MPYPVYSTQFIALGGVTRVQIYVVPDGFRGVLRDVDVACVTGDVDERLFYLFCPSPNLMWTATAPSSTPFFAQWRGRQVLNPGDRITFDPQVGAWDVAASGYLLELP